MQQKKVIKIGAIIAVMMALVILPSTSAVEHAHYAIGGIPNGPIADDEIEFYDPLGTQNPLQIEDENTILIDESEVGDGLTVFLPGDPPPPCAKAGEMKYVDGHCFPDAELFVHTYAAPESDGILKFQFIFGEVIVTETRPIHEPYLGIPTMSIYRNGEWLNGPILASFIINWDYTCDDMPIGCYGIGICPSEDRLVPFRLNMRLYIYNRTLPDGRMEFILNETASDSGLWYYDTNEPGVDGLTPVVQEVAIKQVMLG